MQYMLLIYEAEEIWENMSEAERGEVMQGHYAMHERMKADNVEWSGHALMPTATATSLRTRGGKRELRDGPFAETKEQLGGYYLIDAPSLEAALDYAAMIPTANVGTIEVRPVINPEDYPEA